jgi:hypothetical protein
MELVLRREVEAADLVRRHPPIIDDAHKRMVFELCAGADTTGPLAITRWRAGDIAAAWHDAEVTCVRGRYAYDRASEGVWHVNFADPALFFGYGGGLLAQDELQALEHPVLGSVREALASDKHALTVERGIATPVLVAGAERRCALDTTHLYGNAFACAPVPAVRSALTVLQPPTRTNLIAIAAPAHGHGTYRREQLEQILVTAYTGFAAAVAETTRLWPGVPVEVRTGFWGCGAFGGNRHVMTILQLAAARLAGVSRVRFYAFDDAGQAVLDEARGVRLGADPIDAVLERGYRWGVSDGN